MDPFIKQDMVTLILLVGIDMLVMFAEYATR